MNRSTDPNRPCEHPGCNKTGVHVGTNSAGERTYRRFCLKHHNERTAAKHGLKSIAHVVAKNAGFEFVADYRNSTHPYRQHRKDYCENRDGRLGFICTAHIPGSWVLDVDHKDGNPANNSQDNLHTLCKVCHAHKTRSAGDSRTPGRKTLGIKY